MKLTTNYKRFETRDYQVKVTFASWENGKPPTNVHVNVKDRGDGYTVNHTYFYETSRRRGSAIRYIEGTDRRFALGSDRLSKWSGRPGESVARRFARAILAGVTLPGECGCKACGGSGWKGGPNCDLVNTPVCPECQMTGTARPVPEQAEAGAP